MTRWKIANLSVNGTKHWPAICAWLRATRPDIVTLQKTGRAEHVPERDLRGLGYDLANLPWRSRSDAGVAVLTREGLGRQEACVRELPGAESPESRFLTVRVRDLWVSSVYAPYGPPPGDEQSSNPPHERAIDRRVAWLNRLRDHVDGEGYGTRDRLGVRRLQRQDQVRWPSREAGQVLLSEGTGGAGGGPRSRICRCLSTSARRSPRESGANVWSSPQARRNFPPPLDSREQASGEGHPGSLGRTRCHTGKTFRSPTRDSGSRWRVTISAAGTFAAGADILFSLGSASPTGSTPQSTRSCALSSSGPHRRTVSLHGPGQGACTIPTGPWVVSSVIATRHRTAGSPPSRNIRAIAAVPTKDCRVTGSDPSVRQHCRFGSAVLPRRPHSAPQLIEQFGPLFVRHRGNVPHDRVQVPVPLPFLCRVRERRESLQHHRRRLHALHPVPADLDGELVLLVPGVRSRAVELAACVDERAERSRECLEAVDLLLRDDEQAFDRGGDLVVHHLRGNSVPVLPASQYPPAPPALVAPPRRTLPDLAQRDSVVSLNRLDHAFALPASPASIPPVALAGHLAVPTARGGLGSHAPRIVDAG